jgi:hypothetical protein
MELKDFVSETLRQIIAGVRDAQAYAADQGAKVVPEHITFRTDQGLQMWDKRDGTPVQIIEFDVGVTTTEGTATKGGIGVLVGAIGLGSQGQSNSSNQLASRIKFSIPIGLPKQVESKPTTK